MSPEVLYVRIFAAEFLSYYVLDHIFKSCCSGWCTDPSDDLVFVNHCIDGCISYVQSAWAGMTLIIFSAASSNYIYAPLGSGKVERRGLLLCNHDVSVIPFVTNGKALTEFVKGSRLLSLSLLCFMSGLEKMQPCWPIKTVVVTVAVRA